MYQLEVEPLDLGPDVRAISLELAEADEYREPVRGADAGRMWGHVLRATAADEPWALDFFSHVERVRDFCQRRDIPFREPSRRSIVIPAPEPVLLGQLLERFQDETFGARAGSELAAPDTALEGDLAAHGLDAYHTAFTRYFFCGVCQFDQGSLVLLSEKLWASEVIRRVRPALAGLEVEVHLPA